MGDAEMQEAQAAQGPVRRAPQAAARARHSSAFALHRRTGRTKAEQIESILERSRGVQNKIQGFNSTIDSILDCG